ncbi:MAG: hypothetical protein K8S27_10720 [Candidatus Omnitrophica bacterium]|nr:hypothetical protein [Candidatus Omnitrophota bacterium]
MFLSVFYAEPSEAKKKLLAIDAEMQKKVKLLQEQMKEEDFNACQITTTIRDHDMDNPYLFYSPKEITFSYEGRDITTLLNLRAEKGIAALDGLGLNCIEFNKYVYVFLDAVQPKIRRRFNLPYLSYVIYSNDSGATWSKLLSLEQVSQKGEFAIPQRDFHRNVSIFGDRSGHSFSIYNKLDETTYLLDPELKKLRSIPIYNRLTNLNNPEDFFFFEGVIYSVRGSCQRRSGHIVCPDVSYLDMSEDYGRNWQTIALPNITRAEFFVYDNQLFLLYLASQKVKWYSVVHGLDRSSIAGKLYLRKLSRDGRWSEQVLLSKTVSTLKDVYVDDLPVIVWQDTRHHRSKWCGYIPFIGCVDPDPFYGPRITYVGYLNPKTLNIQNEAIIEHTVGK